MQRCTCTVRLAGELTQTTVRHGVSPAEVVILRHMHGDDAVQDFKPGGNDRGKRINEADRLQARYKKHYGKCFPGANPKLPERFDEIGVDLLADDGGDEKPAGKAAKKATKRASKKAAATADGPQQVTADDLADKGEGEGDTGDDASTGDNADQE